MNKIYQRIDWENYPSSATPLNEDNLNKMDYAIDKLDDRIVTHETTKLNTATGNTLVKNVTFNEKTGVFTIEKLSGSKITINTALEKISTNFHFNPTTQKLVLTLIDGTVQEIDLSALITQYEFLESDTITFEIDANGKIKANILNGSITGEKLEPNYLANVTLQAKNAKTSADNAKTSEELAYQYAEEAKESASQTAKSDAKNITYDNTESGLSATNVKDALDEVAQCSVSAIATDTTITDSTNAPLIYGKFKGYTIQNGEPTPDNPVEINGLAKDGAIEVTTTGKNMQYNSDTYDGWIVSGNTTFGTVVTNETYNGGKVLKYTKGWQYIHPPAILYKKGTYTISFDAKATTNGYAYLCELTNAFITISGDSFKRYSHTFTITEDTNNFIVPVLPRDTTISELYIANIQVEMNVTATPYEPYTETTATIPTDAPLYEGDYLEVYADGSGKLVRKMSGITIDGSSVKTTETDGFRKYGLNYAYLWKHDKALTQSRVVANIGIGITNVDVSVPPSCEGVVSNPNNTTVTVVLKDERTGVVSTDTDAQIVNKFNTWLQSNPVTVIYELAEPTETPLTAEQVAEFKKLYTFEPVTNVFCDGEVEVLYYKNTDSGETVGIVHKKVEASEKTIEQLPNTFAKKSIYDNNAISYGRKVDSTVGEGSIAFGLEVEAPINYGVAVGAKTRAGDCAFACGHTNSANGLCSSASGFNTTVDGECSHVEGVYTKASSNCQHVQGKYNVEDTEHKYAHIIGGGNSETDRKNIHTIDWNGNADFAGEVKCSNVLKTLTECEASTKDTDIASAMALGELKESFKSIILNSAYPIGTVYMSTQNTSPATFLGGTWSAISADKYFKTITSGTGGSTGGSSTSGSTTLTVNQIPSHNHAGLTYGTGGGSVGLGYSCASGSNHYSIEVGSGTAITTEYTGGGQGHTHTITPPYYSVYAWVRTA